MRSSTCSESLLFDPEIERTCRQNRKATREENKVKTQIDLEMAENPRRDVDEDTNPRALRDYAMPTVNGASSSITRPPVQANNFEIKPALIQMIQTAVQFGGQPNDDPNAHIANFLEICDTLKHNGVSDDAIRLRLFPFSLRDKARAWLQSLPAGSITTWNDLAQKFLAKFFPPARTAKLRNDIQTFMQFDMETLYEAWERFKDLLRRCPHHGLPKWLVVQTFYNGLNNHTRINIDAAAGGSLMGKSLDEAYDLLEEMANNNYQWPNERNIARRPAGVHEIDAITALNAKVDTIFKKLDQMSINSVNTHVQVCEICTGQHATRDCPIDSSFMPPVQEQVQYVANQARQPNNPYSNTYTPAWKNHPNFSWGNQSQQQNYQNFQNRGPPGFPQQEKKSNLEDLVATLTKATTDFMGETRANFQNQQAAIKNLEVQMGQLANIVTNRTQGSLPSNTETNPKEHVMAITLRSGEQLEEQPRKEPVTEQVKEQAQKEAVAEEKPKEKKEEPLKPYIPPVPFPQRLLKNKDDKNFLRFLEVFKKLHINIPFAEALAQMPSYAKFLKDILSKKRRLEDHETVMLTEECSAIIQNKLPSKLKDPGSFTIPCNIGNIKFTKALCDLGASINLMPLSVFRKLGLGDMKPTSISLQLADRSVTYPRGIVEDVLIKVDKFIFPADFIVLDMEVGREVPLILGRPFLATGRALIDVHEGTLTLRVGQEEVTFNVSNFSKHPLENDECFILDVITESVDNLEHDLIDCAEEKIIEIKFEDLSNQRPP